MFESRAHQKEADLVQRSQELHYLNERLRTAQRVAQLGSWELCLADSTLSCSEETYRILGVSATEIEGKLDRLLATVHPDDRQHVAMMHRSTMAGQPTLDLTYRIVHPDGTIRHIHERAEHILDNDGRPVTLCGTLHDISEHIHAEKKLEARLARLQLLSQITRAISDRSDLTQIYLVVTSSLEEKLPADFCAIATCDPGNASSTILSAGPRSSALVDPLRLCHHFDAPFSTQGLPPCTDGHWFYEPDLERLDFPLAQWLLRASLRSAVFAPLQSGSCMFAMLVVARRSTSAFSSGECEFLRQLGEHLSLALHQVQLHRDLQSAYDDLQRTQNAVIEHERLRAFGEMASGVAHDINNAVSPISLYAESMLRTEVSLTPKGRKQLEVIVRTIRDVANTIARLRDFYRPSLTSDRMAKISLNELVEQVVDLTRARWRDMPQQHGTMIEMHLELQPDLGAIAGDESELRVALTNLIFNSVDAMPTGGTLTIRTYMGSESHHTCAPRHVLLEIVDSGIGMTEDTRKRCIEPFFSTKENVARDLDCRWCTALCNGTTECSLSIALPVQAPPCE